MFTRQAGESDWEAFKKGAGTVAAKAATGVVGLPGDIVGLADYLVTGAQSLGSDKSHAELMRDLAARNQAKREAGQWQFPTSEEVYKEVADRYKLGEYEPESDIGKLAMAAGVGAAGMIGPGMAVKGARAIIPGAKKLLAAGPSVGEFGKLAATGAGAGAAAELAAEHFESPLAPLAAGLAVPLAVHGARAIYNPERRARERLYTDLGDKDASLALIQGADKEHPIPGIRYTLDTLTEDPKLAQAAYALETRSPAFKSYMDQLRAEQVEARRAHLARAAGDDAEELAATNELQRIQAQLAKSRARAHDVLTDSDIPEAGGLFRGMLGKAYEKHKAETGRLFNRIPKDAIVAPDNAQAVAKTITDNWSEYAKQRGELSGPLKEAIDLVNQQDKALSFPQLRELEKTLEDLRVTAVGSPDGSLRYQAGLIGDLKGGIAKDLDAVIPGPSGGNPRAILDKAKDHFKLGQELYQNAYLKSSLRWDPRQREYRMLSSAAANRFVPAGVEGYNATKAALEATGYAPDALWQLEDIATGRLREMMTGNTVLTPEQLQTWKTRYGKSIEALEEARDKLGMPKYMDQFHNAADATRALDTMQRGAAGSLIGAQTPEEVGRFMNTLVRDPKGVNTWRDLISQMPDGEKVAAAEGLRRAHIDTMIAQFSNQLNGRLRANEFAKYVNTHRRALSEIYGPQFKNIEDVLTDLQRVNKMRTAKGVDIGSNTAKNLADAMARAGRNNESIGSVIAQISLAHTLAGVPGAAGAGVTKALWLKDLLSAAGSAKADAHYMHALMDPTYAKVLLQPMFKNGRINAEALRELATRSAVLSGYLGGVQEPTRESIERQGRASGGRIGVVPAKRAAQLILQAERTHKQLTQITKPLLNLPDEHITKALSVANEAI